MTVTDMQLQDVLVQYQVLWEDWMPKDATIALAYEEQYIYYAPKHYDIRIQIGTQPAETSIAYQTITKKQKVAQLIEDQETKTSYYGVGYPITIQERDAALVVVLPPSYAKHQSPTLKFVTGRLEDEWMPVAVSTIAYFESYNKKNWFYIEGQQYQVSLTMKELSERLPEEFIRIHRSFIINIHNISKISRDITSNLVIVTRDGTHLPVSQSYVADLRKALEF